ncbi:protein Njmu-R1-like isoform X3 [Sinocyclocheilus rhinocerous]|uniref:protein Njmu-R1-like isoform X3 n=1 Tax=Sinocyclocheilus rhinocerous TaxID=307959 RepID=UPI0007BABD19|nr:PREDICTED: protein Njmu-R1-like isoform X3 [Sinocyclocheilus rhinocerous]
MFTSQTSSFQESIDVDERDVDFDNEEIAGYSQNIQQINSYYAIYYYQNTSLTLLDASLPPEAEPELRSYISRRLSKGALLGGMGNIATVELSIPEQAVGCYCCLLEQEKSPEQPEADGNGWVVCLLGGSEKGLNLFRIELDKYVQGLQGCLTPEMQNLETQVRPYVIRWYEESVMHIHRVVQLVQANVGYLLHAALSHKLFEVTGADEKTKADIARFIKAASLQGLVQEASLCKAISEDSHSSLIIDCSTSPPTLTNEVSNRFCDDWIQAFLNAAERFNPFLLRQILENFKLKAIQDMNNLKRFIRQAEMSHYALFRCCLFLQSCGNGDVLLQNARAEHSSLPEACGIINVLEEFLREHAQGTLY